MAAKKPSETATITEHETAQVERANAAGATPVMFVHGLYLLPSSWDRWAELFEAAGYVVLSPGWPDDPETTPQARDHPEVLAGKSVGQVADHFAAIASSLDLKPAIIGHSFGGLIAQILAGRGLAAVTVAIDPAPFRGVLPLPLSALRVASPALSNPANRHRAVPLTFDQFRYAFANAVGEDEAKQLFETYAVPAPGLPLFQAAAANLHPWTEVKVDTKNPDRGPLLIMSGEKDHTVPPAIANASYKRQARNEGVTEITQMRPAAGMPSPSTAAGGKSPTPRSPLSGGSPRPPRPGRKDTSWILVSGTRWRSSPGQARASGWPPPRPSPLRARMSWPAH
jgi:non-heme chloroperoxidase